MDAHIGKNDIWIRQAGRQLEVRGEAKGGIEKDIVHFAVAFPEWPIDVVILIIVIRTVQVDEVTTKQASQEHDTAKRRDFCRASRAGTLFKGLCLFWSTHIKRLF
jgi:hypothetical protein